MGSSWPMVLDPLSVHGSFLKGVNGNIVIQGRIWPTSAVHRKAYFHILLILVLFGGPLNALTQLKPCSEPQQVVAHRFYSEGPIQTASRKLTHGPQMPGIPAAPGVARCAAPAPSAQGLVQRVVR